MELETRSKKELMQYEFNLNVQLKELELKSRMELAEKSNATALSKEAMKVEGRISGAPNTDNPTKDFESAGNDTLGGFDMGRFEAS